MGYKNQSYYSKTQGVGSSTFWNRYREVRQNDFNDLRDIGDYDDENSNHRYLKKFDEGRDTRHSRDYSRRCICRGGDGGPLNDD